MKELLFTYNPYILTITFLNQSFLMNLWTVANFKVHTSPFYLFVLSRVSYWKVSHLAIHPFLFHYTVSWWDHIDWRVALSCIQATVNSALQLFWKSKAKNMNMYLLILLSQSKTEILFELCLLSVSFQFPVFIVQFIKSAIYLLK